MRRFALLVLMLASSCAARESSRVTGEPTPQPTGSAEPTRHDEDAAWYLRSISSDGRTIAFVYTMSGVASGCERKGSPRVDETADQVRVHAVKSVIDDRNRPCTEELGFIEETVTLMEPLGSRALVGCRPDHSGRSEDAVCRDRKRGEQAGIPPSPFPSG